MNASSLPVNEVLRATAHRAWRQCICLLCLSLFLLMAAPQAALAAEDGVKEALEKRQPELVANGTCMRNTTAVKRALLTIRKAGPQAVVIVGAYKPAAACIKTAESIGFDAVFAALSFVGSSALAEELGSIDDTVLVSQVVPIRTMLT